MNPTSIGICFSCGVRREHGLDTMAWDTRARVDRALMLHRLDFVDLILCTGGVFQRGQRTPIASLMKEYLIQCGVPKRSIFAETKSAETAENIKFGLALLKRKRFFDRLKNTEQLRLVLISEPRHLRRIELITRAYLEKYGVGKLVPLLFEPVHYAVSEYTDHIEGAMYHHSALDPLGEGEIFQHIRRERRRASHR